MNYPSILNEVIGPVMRGPSSSHCAAAVRIGLVARALMNNTINSVLVEFDKDGSLPTTHASQGSDMGLCGGLLGFGADDERLISYESQMKLANIQIRYLVGNYGDPHPNTYRLTLHNSDETHFLIAVSTGGGMFEIIELDGNKISIQGDCHETLIFFKGNQDAIIESLKNKAIESNYLAQALGDQSFLEIKTHDKLDDSLVNALMVHENIISIKQIPPVLPILTPGKMEIPFDNAAQMLDYGKGQKLGLDDLALEYESIRGGTSKKDVLDKMIKIIRTMKASIESGIMGTNYRDRIIGQQSDKFIDNLQKGRLIELGVLNKIILYVTSLMEVKSSMGVIVAAPTAGSCGGLPGAIIGTADVMGFSHEQSARAMLAAGMIGVFIAKYSTFAAEVGGCQAECGAGSGMAAAGLVTLMGGSANRAVAAASMALQNSFGMVCDPVANRVEVPCLGKNIMAASNAVSCANIALAGFDEVIQLDEVITAMDEVGKSIHSTLRCTALGGLSVTRTSKQIEKRLQAISKK